MPGDTTTAIDVIPPPRRSRNATTHGLYSAVTVAAGHEQPTDWLAFHDAMLLDLDPHGALESALASRAAALCWRLRRAPIAEADAIERAIARHDSAAARKPIELTPEQRDELGFYADAMVAVPDPPSPVPDPASLERIARTEAHLHKQLVQTLHELEALQARRRGEHTPLARVDVDVRGLTGAGT